MNRRSLRLFALTLTVLSALLLAPATLADNIFEEFFGSDDDEWEDLPPWLLQGGGPYGGGGYGGNPYWLEDDDESFFEEFFDEFFGNDDDEWEDLPPWLLQGGGPYGGGGYGGNPYGYGGAPHGYGGYPHEEGYSGYRYRRHHRNPGGGYLGQ